MLKYISSLLARSKKWFAKKSPGGNNYFLKNEKFLKFNFPKFQSQTGYFGTNKSIVSSEKIQKWSNMFKKTEKNKGKGKLLKLANNYPTMKSIMLVYGGFKKVFRTIFLFRKYKIKTIYKVVTTLLLFNAYGLFKLFKS